MVDGVETDAAAGTEQQGTAPDTPLADESGPHCRPVLAVRPLGPRDVVRPPHEAAGGWEGALAVANAVAAGRAERHVATVFPEWGRFALSGAAAAPRAMAVDEAAVAALDLPELADELLSTFDLGESRLGLSEGGEAVPPGRLLRGHADPFAITGARVGPVARALADGACVSIVGVDEYSPHLMRHFEDLERSLTGMGRMDLVLAGPGGAVEVGVGDGFARVLAAVAGGAIVEPATPPGRADEEADRAADPGETLGIAGSVAVFLPPTHGATVRAEAAALVAVWVVPVTTRATVLALMADESAFFPAFRAELPYDLGVRPASYGGSLFDDADRFRQELLDLVDGPRIGRALGRLRAAIPARSAGSFAAVTALMAGDPMPAARMPTPGGVLVHTAPTAENAAPAGPAPDQPLTMVVAGRRLELTEHAARTLALLADGERHDIAAIHHCPEGDPACGRRLLRALVEAGQVDLGGQVS